jgi:hypothetical protein
MSKEGAELTALPDIVAELGDYVELTNLIRCDKLRI